MARQPAKPPQPGPDIRVALRPGGLLVSLLNRRSLRVHLTHHFVQVPEQSSVVLPDSREPGYKTW